MALDLMLKSHTWHCKLVVSDAVCCSKAFMQKHHSIQDARLHASPFTHIPVLLAGSPLQACHGTCNEPDLLMRPVSFQSFAIVPHSDTTTLHYERGWGQTRDQLDEVARNDGIVPRPFAGALHCNCLHSEHADNLLCHCVV